MSGLTVAVEPTREPLTVIEVRDALRLDDDVDETLVMSYIIAAREWAEKLHGPCPYNSHSASVYRRIRKTARQSNRRFLYRR